MPKTTETVIAEQRTLSQLVDREVIHCCSSMVAHFQHPEACIGDVSYDDDILPLLSRDDWQTPVEYYVDNMDKSDCRDYLDSHGVKVHPNLGLQKLRGAVLSFILNNDPSTCRIFAETNRIDPEQCEAYEHWIVSSWIARKLAEHGEIVGELFDFHIWGRCTTGQAISVDCVIREIASDMEILPGQRNAWN